MCLHPGGDATMTDYDRPLTVWERIEVEIETELSLAFLGSTWRLILYAPLWLPLMLVAEVVSALRKPR